MGQALAAASPAAAAVLAAADAALGESISRPRLRRARPTSSTGPRTPSRRSSPSRSRTSPPSASAWAALGIDAPPAGLRRRPFDGPVLGPRRGRGDLARGRRPARPRARPADAGVRRRPRRGDGRDPRPRRRAPSRTSSSGPSAHGVFGVANRNAPGQVVVSGERAAIEAARRDREGARRPQGDRPAGLRRRPLAAHGRGRRRDARAPSPTSTFHDPTVPLLANADARPITTADAARAELVEHLTAGVDWVAAVERMTAAGVTTFIEVGPGRVLTGLIKRIAPDAEALAARRPVVARPSRASPSRRPTTA